MWVDQRDGGCQQDQSSSSSSCDTPSFHVSSRGFLHPLFLQKHVWVHWSCCQCLSLCASGIMHLGVMALRPATRHGRLPTTWKMLGRVRMRTCAVRESIPQPVPAWSMRETSSFPHRYSTTNLQHGSRHRTDAAQLGAHRTMKVRVYAPQTSRLVSHG